MSIRFARLSLMVLAMGALALATAWYLNRSRRVLSPPAVEPKSITLVPSGSDQGAEAGVVFLLSPAPSAPPVASRQVLNVTKKTAVSPRGGTVGQSVGRRDGRLYSPVSSPALPGATSAPASRPAVRQSKVVTMLVTGYCPCRLCCGRFALLGPGRQLCGGKGPTITQAMGRWGGWCSADPNMPFGAFGTMISVPGYLGGRPVPVLDRGAKIRGRHIEVYFPTHAEALRWGKQKLAVTIVGRPGDEVRPRRAK